MSALRFGAIADDFTGATDLAGMLARGGLATVQAIGLSGLQALDEDEAQAIVVALKTRSVDAAIAVRVSLEAVDALGRRGAQYIYFKYCSTFDSTPEGNIGPVAEALRALLQAPFVPFVPAFPENGRRVFRGHLFVGNTLLHESGMEAHPLNPMRDSNLVRVLQGQSETQVGLITHDMVQRGSVYLLESLRACAAVGKPLVVLDAIDDGNLDTIAEAVLESPLATGASALGFHIAQKVIARPVSDPTARRISSSGSRQIIPREGRSAILSGSCSRRTLEQIAHFRQRQHPTLRVAVDELLNGKDVVRQAMQWFADQPSDVPSLIYTSAEPSQLAPTHQLSIGRQIENALATIAQELIAQGVTRLIVAGGETSGAIVQGLRISALRIGKEISPGVPWTQVVGSGPAAGLCLALKSGNFGGPEFFTEAFECLSNIESAT
jgi:uncharacterized protein YgbK (DUF1537 family)